MALVLKKLELADNIRFPGKVAPPVGVKHRISTPKNLPVNNRSADFLKLRCPFFT